MSEPNNNYQYFTLAEAVKPKDLTFTDGYYTLKKEKFIGDFEFNYNAYNILKDVNDVKTNNYSNIILTKKQLNSDIFQIETEKKKDYTTFITKLYFKLGNVQLNFVFDSDAALSFGSPGPSLSLRTDNSTNNNDYIFSVNLYDELCTISHHDGIKTYYLAYKNSNFYFSSDIKDATYFCYHRNENILKLYYKVSENILYTIKYKKQGDEDYKLELASEEKFNDSEKIYFNSEIESIDSGINFKWVVYENNIDIDKITGQDLKTQFIVHHEYSDDSNIINCIPLKNNLTYQGSVTNGSNYRTNTFEPINHNGIEVDFRNYVSLNTGYNQELGTDNITLTYLFTDQVIQINPGDDCLFTIPENSEGDIFGSMYPYEKLNINDSSFVKNGAFASSSPYLADKVKKYQKKNTSGIEKYGTYLCTWLKQDSPDTEAKWCDRFYQPDKCSQRTALMTNHGSFIEDRLSLLTLEPGYTYKYSRISNDIINDSFEKLNEHQVSIVKDQNYNNVKLENGFKFNNEYWRKISADSLKSTKALNFNTNLYINPDKKIGIQLFGSDYKEGFTIQNRKDLCPFTYYNTNESLYLLNNEFQIANEFNFLEKYNSTIKYVIIGAPFDDIYVIASPVNDNEDEDKISNNVSLYIFDYDLRLKTKGDIEFKSLSKLFVIKHGLYNKNSLYLLISEYDNKENTSDEFLNDIIFKLSLKTNISENKSSFEAEEYNNYISNIVSDDKDTHLKSIFMFNDILYAFNYDCLKLCSDNDTLYGLYKKLDNDKIRYCINNLSLSRLTSNIESSYYPEFISYNSIDAISFDSNGNFALVRGFDKETEKTNEKTLEIFDKSKTKIYNYPLTDYDNVISLDFYRYIDKQFKEHDVFVALMSNGNFITAVEYQIKEERVETYSTLLPSSIYKNNRYFNFNNIINSNYFITKLTENNLYFNLYLSQNEVISYKWPMSDQVEGWYNFNIAIDIDKKIFEIKINDKIVYSDFPVKTINFLTSNIFNSDYYIGTVGKKYGTSLNEVLYTSLKYSPYVCSNSKIENTTLFTKILTYDEYQTIRLKYSKINPLALTIPCGIRNGIEEIERYFKFAPPGSISNKLKINIDGLQEYKSKIDLESLKANILYSLANSDCLIDINEIEFI